MTSRNKLYAALLLASVMLGVIVLNLFAQSNQNNFPGSTLAATVVQTNQSNTYSTGTQDFTGATAAKVATQAANDNSTNASSTAYPDRVIAKPLLTGNAVANTVQVPTSDFTSSSASQTAITGLTWTLPANTAATYSFECRLIASEATGLTAITWSFNDVTLAPTNAMGSGQFQTGASAVAFTNVVAQNTTGSKTIANATPGTIAANFGVTFGGTIQQPSGVASVLQIEVGVGGGANVLTVFRGSKCSLTATAN